MEENQRPDLGEDTVEYEDDEYLMKCVVDPLKKTFYLYSNEGDEKEVVCDNTEQFMNVVKVITDRANPEIITYADVAVK